MEENHIDEQFDFKKELFKYAYYWKYFLISTIITFSLSYLYIRYTNPIYSVESKIKIIQDKDKGFMLPTNLLLATKSQVNIENEIETVRSKRLFGRVISQLNLTTSYFYKGKFRNTEAWNAPIKITSLHNKDSIFKSFSFNILAFKKGYKITLPNGKTNYIKGTHIKTTINKIDLLIEPNSYAYNKNDKRELLIQITPFKFVLESLIAKISVSQVGEESQIINLKIQDVNINKSTDIIDKIVDVFNDDGINDRRLVNLKTVKFIDDRFKSLTKELDSIESVKRDFKKSKEMSFIEADAGLDITKKATSKETLFTIETQIELSNLLQDALNSKQPTILPANIGLDNIIINELIAEYNTLILQRDKLLKTAGKENPVLKGLDSQIEVVKNNINESIYTYNKQLKIRQNQQQFDFTKSKNIVLEIPSNEKILRSIERQQQIKENLYLLLLQKREEAAIAYAVTEPSVKIIDYANASLTPVAPKKIILYLAALIIGLLIPFIIIFIRFAFDTTIKNINDSVYKKSQIPVIGEIPQFEDFKIFKDKNDRSVHAESFRILSSNVNFSLPLKETGKGQVILVTSSIMGEGKTFITTNLALALASYNKKILMIGADMRKPKLHLSLNMDKVDKGLSSYLHNKDIHWKDVIVDKNPYNENLDIIFSGTIPPNPSNIISNGRFETMINEAKLEYDYVIIDTAPTIYVNDTFLISNLADLTVYLTRFDHTERRLIEYAKTLKDEAKLKNMVFILNGISQTGAHQYNYKYSYSYNYGYGYGYGENSNNKKSFIKNILNKFKK